MAEILLNHVINDEIKLERFIKWLSKHDPQDQYLDEFLEGKCSQTDFLTYFLNFVHEEILCRGKYGDSPQKNFASRRLELGGSDENPTQKTSTAIEDHKNKTSSSIALNNSMETSDVFSESVIQYSNSNCSHITSTPKFTRLLSESNLTNGHLSPISPLYKAQNSFSTPKTRRQGSTFQKSTEKTPGLCLGDFIVNKKVSAKKKASRSLINEENNDESSKRIKPTSLSQVKTNSSFRKTDNSFNNFQNTKEVSMENLNQSRSFLAKERLKILWRRDSGDTLATVSTKKLAALSNFTSKIEPNINFVTNKKELERLADIYVAVLTNSLVLNVNSEIYFLISLLVSQRADVRECREQASSNSSEDFHMGVDYLSDEEGEQNVHKAGKRTVDPSDLFTTIHNVIFFAVKCLESQLLVLKHYDRSMLKLLSSNHRMRAFNSEFADQLSRIAEKKPDRTVELSEDITQTNVCFNLDTDNRANFPSDPSFHSFRKQRDLFYEILRIWENNHLVTGWNFAISLGGKIRGLFGLQSESANFMHFSRLFKAQLLCTCGKTQKEEGLSESQLPFLSSFPNVDANKLKRLKSRLVTKQSSTGINPLPTFTGHQEFYRDFIATASNYAFNRHLCDTLISEITELNDTSFSLTDLEESGSDVDPSTRKSYVACLRSLRVLAKFLGYVESLPYKSDNSVYTENFLATQVHAREQTAPSFDVKQLLVKSIQVKNLSLTIPWVTEYMAMLDYVTLRLPYYIAVHKILFDLYKHWEIKALSHHNQYNYNVFAIKSCLGWLFELPHFPDSEYFNFCTDSNGENNVQAQKPSTTKTLDDFNVIDQNVLYVCCPYLNEIKNLLSSTAFNSNVTVKHITPVTAIQSSSEMTKKRLEQQLEEAFFNGQPVSVRKTVEFVSERVASTCVKHICNVIVPSFKKDALEELRKYLTVWKETNYGASPAKDKCQKSALRTRVSQMSHNNLKSVKDACEKETLHIANEKIPPAIDSLLAIDVLPQIKDVCHTITTKFCLERVRQWINSHVTLSVFTKDFDSEVQKVFMKENRVAKEKPVLMLPPGGNAKEHNEDTLSAFYLLEKIKVLSIDVLGNPVEIDEDIVLKLLEEAYDSLSQRCDINECAMSYTCTALVDFALLLITHKSDLMTNLEILQKFIRIWTPFGKKSNLFKNLLCPRNAMLLAQSGNPVTAWETLAGFTAFLIKEKLLSCDDFETQCTGFFKKDWDEGSLKNFSIFLHKFLNSYQRYGSASDKFTFLLDFLSDFCSDL